MAKSEPAQSEQQSPPSKPYLKPWYRIARGDERLVLEYGHNRTVFEGKAVASFLPALLEVLDGNHTRAQIAEKLGDAVAPAIDNALLKLDEAQLLLEGPPLPVDTSGPATQSVHLIASREPTDLGLVEQEERLRSASVAVLGSGSQASRLEELMRESGVGQVERRSWEGEGDRFNGATVVMVAPEPKELPRLDDWNRSALDAGVPWMQLLPFDGRIVAVGPLFVPRETCCYRCYLMRREGVLGWGEDFWALQREGAEFPSAAPLEQAAAGLAVLSALRWLVAESGSVPGVMTAIEYGISLTVSAHNVYRVPRCPDCSVLAGQAEPFPWDEAAAGQREAS